MPINPKLKEHLEKNVTMDDAYRTKLLATLEDAPADVQNLWMAQQDYTRQVNAFKIEQTDWKKKADDFYDTSNKNIKAWQDEVKKANDAMSAAQARVTELEVGGGGRTPEQSEAVTKEIQRLNTAITALQTGIDDKFKAMVTPTDLEKAGGNWAGFIGEQILTLNELSAQHQEQFGKRLTKQEASDLITFANQKTAELKHPVSLDDAYKMKMGSEIEKLHDAKVAAAAIEQYKSTHELPGAGGPSGPGPGGVSEKGPLQIRMEQLRNAGEGKKEGTGYSSWQEAAAAGADELVKEGKY